MKLKRLPEDFTVEELPSIAPAATGRFTFYRLSKRGLGTPEAVEAILRRWNLAGGQLSYGGMKDRHAQTIQYLTIEGGPRRPLHQTNLDLEPLGYLTHPYRAAHFEGNRFTIVLRDLTEAASARAAHALDEIAQDGLPNYFDDQRFGSIGESGEFIAEAWLKGQHERALFLALAELNPHDRRGNRTEKAILRECWGKWSEAKARLDRSHARSLVTYLVDHPEDFRGAFARLSRTLRSLYFSAFQSHLWNSILANLIVEHMNPEQCAWVDFETARLPFPRALDAERRAAFVSWFVPLPCARTPLPTGPVGRAIASMQTERGLEWTDLRVKHLKDVFFSKGVRAARFDPVGLSQSVEPDELYPKREKMKLTFDLAKGSYATILVKRITLAA